MKALYFNNRSGFSGDMIVGALLDLTGKDKYLERELKKLNLENFKIKVSKKSKGGIKSTKFDVITKKENHHRHLKDINKLIRTSRLNNKDKNLAKKIFLELGKAEAKVHKSSLNEIHFHEVGAIDSIVDIISAAILINKINPKKIYCSYITEGNGFVNIKHGKNINKVRLPVPAVKEILKGIPMNIVNINSELVTPTGAAIIKTVTNEFVEDLELKNKKTGFGSGTKDLGIPNVLEVNYGELLAKKDKILIETNIDDMNPELYQYIISKLMKKGALDAYIQPCVMKKDRPGVVLTVICLEKDRDKFVDMLFDETTTFGLRINKLHRYELEREFKKVKTKYGTVRIKIGKKEGKIKSIKPEYEDCKKLANKNKVPLKEIYREINKKI